MYNEKLKVLLFTVFIMIFKSYIISDTKIIYEARSELS